MRPKIRTVSLWAGGLAALAMAAFLGYAFSLQGTLGLAQWRPDWRRNFLFMAAIGALPVVVAAAGRLTFRDASRKPGRVFALIAAVLAGISIASSAGLFYYLLGTSRAIAGPIPARPLVDPRAGLAGSGGSVRVSISSDPHWGAPRGERLREDGHTPERRRGAAEARRLLHPRR